jgi:hypothetical protein
MKADEATRVTDEHQRDESVARLRWNSRDKTPVGFTGSVPTVLSAEGAQTIRCYAVKRRDVVFESHRRLLRWIARRL